MITMLTTAIMRHDYYAAMERALTAIRARDEEIARELDLLAEKPEKHFAAERLSATWLRLADLPEATARKATELRVARPVLTVVGGKPRLEFPDADSEVWRKRLEEAAPRLAPVIAAVGRIEVEGHPDADWFGTGFLVRHNVIATNHHVADHFAEKAGSELRFKRNIGDEMMAASIDLLEEDGRPESLVFTVDKILHLEADDGRPDLALLRVSPKGDQPLPPALVLATDDVGPNVQVAAVGYPAQDSRMKHAELMDRIFGKIYDKKRLSPGLTGESENGFLLHDCSVLRGNSGSPLVNLATGEVVAVHSVGEFMAKNYAVPARDLAAILNALDNAADEEHSAPPAI